MKYNKWYATGADIRFEVDGKQLDCDDVGDVDDPTKNLIGSVAGSFQSGVFAALSIVRHHNEEMERTCKCSTP